MYLIKITYLIFVLSLPMVGIFNISDNITLPLFFGAILFVFKFNKIKFFKEDIFYLFFLICMLLSLIYNYSISNLSSVKYFFGYVVVFLFFQKTNVLYYSHYKDKFYKFLYYTTVILLIYTIYEFFSINFMPNLFVDFPRIHMKQYDSVFLGKYIRARGYMEESGHFAAYLEFSIPLILFYLDYNKKNKTIFILILLVCIFFINSAINVVLLGLFFIIYLMKDMNFTLQKYMKFMIIFFSFIIIINFIEFNIYEVINSLELLINKAFLKQKDISVIDRTYRIKEALNVLKKNYFLGIGPKNLSSFCTTYYLSNMDTSLNLIIDLVLYSGILGFISFSIYIFIIFYKAFCLRKDIKFYIIFSLILVFIHYQIITNYWYPWMWIIISIIQAEYELLSK